MIDTSPRDGKVGEQTGRLGELLNSVADFYDEEMETSMAKSHLSSPCSSSYGVHRVGDAAGF